MSFVTIIIEFDTGVADRSAERPKVFGQLLHLVESHQGAIRTFTLQRGTEPAYTLTAAETDELLRLLGQIAVEVPWQTRLGMDGCTYELILRGPMSEMTFRWWMEAPQGWESVGAVADYVMGLAKDKG